MIILAHRGYWNCKIKSNSPEALKTALEKGYGFESDIRDYMGNVVISHDVADKRAQKVEEVLAWLKEHQNKFCFAINIKADGLKRLLKEALKKYKITNYFTFDMSLPQMIEYNEMGLKFFTRQSDVEQTPLMYNNSCGVWIDGFRDFEWFSEDILAEHIHNGKMLCLVSPELHGKDNYKAFWKKIKGYNIDFSKVMLCTDFPDEAKEFFNG